MNASNSVALLALLYPALAHVQPSPQSLPERLTVVEAAANTTLFTEHTPCLGFPLVLEGEIKVLRHSDDGRSLELYRVVPGELCLVSSACLFRNQPLSACGITTRPSRLIQLAPDLFQAWLETPAFRNEVMGLFADRMADLTALVDALAFQRLDRRLAAALLGRGQHIRITHQALADELGTVREIVTRLLRRFEQEGWVGLGREQIQVLNASGLRGLADPISG